MCFVEKGKKKKQTDSQAFSDTDVLLLDTADWLLSIETPCDQSGTKTHHLTMTL